LTDKVVGRTLPLRLVERRNVEMANTDQKLLGNGWVVTLGEDNRVIEKGAVLSRAPPSRRSARPTT
jgi:hypothetical protein